MIDDLPHSLHGHMLFDPLFVIVKSLNFVRVRLDLSLKFEVRILRLSKQVALRSEPSLPFERQIPKKKLSRE